ncbi:putative hydrolase [uncultured Paludibacter sp.]|nr:putative hydrolase [uncultured Paludibacter sp.]
MQITFLGTGTSTGVPQVGCTCDVCTSENPKDKRLRSSVLIKINDIQILIDAGPDLRQQLLTHSINHLDGILITHEHYDHLGGIDDIRPLGETTIFCENNVAKAIYRTMHYCFTDKKYPGVPKIEMEEITENDFYLKGIKITPIRVMHAKLPILGYRIGDFAYLTDVKTIPESSFEKLTGLKALVINALRKEEHIAHLNIEDAIGISKKIGAENTYFTHFSHHLGFHNEVDAQLPEKIHLAYDNLSINL